MDITLKQATITYIVPFLSILSFLQALCVVNRLYCSNRQNYKQIQETISHLIQSVTLPETEAFVNKVLTYSGVYPLEFFTSITSFNESLASHMSLANDHAIVLESPAMSCNNCHKGKTVTNWFVYKAPPLGKDAILYKKEGIEKCCINIKQCKYCSSFHYMSFSIDLKKQTKKFYRKSHQEQYFQYTTESVFENKLMVGLLADIIFKHSSFRAFADAYNYLNMSSLAYRFLLNPKRLADAFFCLELCKFYNDNMPYLLKSKTYVIELLMSINLI